jgi:hypothetical protein
MECAASIQAVVPTAVATAACCAGASSSAHIMVSDMSLDPATFLGYRRAKYSALYGVLL